MKRIGIHRLYAKDPIEADRKLWGRESNGVTRRGFLKLSALAAINAAIGSKMVFAQYFPQGMIPAALLHAGTHFAIPGKHPGLIVLNDRPVNAETPPHLLDDKITPANVLFVRNNGIAPEASSVDPKTWTLHIGGESVVREKTYTLPEIKQRFTHHTLQLTLECAGNGRKEFHPPAKGNQWSTGAVGCPEWTGVRLRDVLEDAGIKSDAQYIGYYGKDLHLSGDSSKEAISRGVPMGKALQDESLIAWAINGRDMPLLNGHPLRLVLGGWPASCSGKWLHRIVIRNQVHDGQKMEGQSYRVPCEPVAPGTIVPDAEMCIIEEMPVKSLITYPKTGATINPSTRLAIRGHAWAGERQIEKVELSINFGMTWHPCTLEPPSNRLAWQHFSGTATFPGKGYYEIWARATDDHGVSQPMLLPGWNPKGYLNNACHRIAVQVV